MLFCLLFGCSIFYILPYFAFCRCWPFLVLLRHHIDFLPFCSGGNGCGVFHSTSYCSVRLLSGVCVIAVLFSFLVTSVTLPLTDFSSFFFIVVFLSAANHYFSVAKVVGSG